MTGDVAAEVDLGNVNWMPGRCIHDLLDDGRCALGHPQATRPLQAWRRSLRERPVMTGAGFIAVALVATGCSRSGAA